MEQVKKTHTKYMIKILENKHLVIGSRDAIQVRYEIDWKANDTPMYYIEDNKLVQV